MKVERRTTWVGSSSESESESERGRARNSEGERLGGTTPDVGGGKEEKKNGPKGVQGVEARWMGSGTSGALGFDGRGVEVDGGGGK